MRAAAIIAEYNPFHNGHKYHIDLIRRELAPDYVVVFMSGNFVERGEPAIFDKFTRAKMAVAGGADLVIELAPKHALECAQGFARSAVSLIKSTGVITHLCFSVESGSLESLLRARAMIDKVDTLALKRELMSGKSYPRAISCALGDADVLLQKNALLGIEYIRAIDELKAELQPFVTHRIGPAHDSGETFSQYASASFIRDAIAQGRDVSAFFDASLLPNVHVSMADYSDMIMYRLSTMSKAELLRCRDVSEGLENAILAALAVSNDVEGLLAAIKSKRYTMARLKRIVMRLLLGLEARADDFLPSYIRFLAANEKGTRLLGDIAKHASLPVIARASDAAELSGAARRDFDENDVNDRIYALKAKRGAGFESLRI